MKKILVVIAVVFTTNAFCVTNNIAPPHTILTSCGTSYEFDDAGMSSDDIFDEAEFQEWLDCEGGNELLQEYFNGGFDKTW
ncbi:hypothetical protein [Tenacibaculum insulae]|uniref:hypothetical protein n=1 Tax=Tenacibaculum insulae TaxID=2029677 RepID=UPI003AB2AD17